MFLYFFSFEENINAKTRMSIDRGDLFIEQDFGVDDQVRTLRLTKSNVASLLAAWEGLVSDVKDAKRDVLVETEIGIGDRIKITVSTDFPFLNFRRWTAVSWKKESFPGQHGFTLQDGDFQVFEENLKLYVALQDV